MYNLFWGQSKYFRLGKISILSFSAFFELFTYFLLGLTFPRILHVIQTWLLRLDDCRTSNFHPEHSIEPWIIGPTILVRSVVSKFGPILFGPVYSPKSWSKVIRSGPWSEMQWSDPRSVIFQNPFGPKTVFGPVWDFFTDCFWIETKKWTGSTRTAAENTDQIDGPRTGAFKFGPRPGPKSRTTYYGTIPIWQISDEERVRMVSNISNTFSYLILSILSIKKSSKEFLDCNYNITGCIIPSFRSKTTIPTF